ncbi:MAG: carbohydrate kinase family protein [Amphritea sp.]
MNVMTIGGATIDIVVEAGNGKSFEPGKKIDAEKIAFCLGGGGINSSIVLNKLGGNITLCSAVGDDLEGSILTSKLTSLGIDLSCVSVLSGDITGRSVITISHNAEVSVVAQRGANLNFEGNSLPTTLKHQLMYISATSRLVVERLSVMLENGYADHSKIAFNPGFNQIKGGGKGLDYLCKKVDLVILNQIEAEQLLLTLGCKDVENAPLESLGHRLIEHGLKATLVTGGSLGAYFTSPDDFWFQNSIPVEAASTLGAGDTFGSTFSYYYFSGQSVKMSANLAAINAANTVGKTDANSGSLTEPELFKDLVTLNGSNSDSARNALNESVCIDQT